MRVGLIGCGAIGEVVARHLREGLIPDASLAGIVRRHPSRAGDVSTVEELLAAGPDVVVEAAGAEAVRQHGPAVVGGGVDLLVLSTGALADPVTDRLLRDAGSGRILISTGAVGGLDILRALHLSGGLVSVSITSTTVPEAIADAVGEVDRSAPGDDGEVSVFSGTAREVAVRFPRISNVAATLALATLGLDHVTAELRMDPTGTRKQHVLRGAAQAGTVTITIQNDLSPSNPRTSAVTPYAVIRYLAERDRRLVVGV